MLTRDISYLNLPESVVQKVEMNPIEDLVLRILREALPDVKVNSLIELDQTEVSRFFVVPRRITGWGIWDGDPRFVDYAGLAVHVFAKDPDADEVGALVSEACRVALRDSALNRDHYDDLGGLISAQMIEEPTKKTDWASSTGPVQFADLPAGYMRYEARYALKVRLPLRKTLSA